PCGDAPGTVADPAPAEAAPSEPVAEPVAVAAGESHADLVAVRRRGAGTELPPNA
ncbi:biotin synthase BioB, partial [Streptomyces botrytidirepellens]